MQYEGISWLAIGIAVGIFAGCLLVLYATVRYGIIKMLRGNARRWVKALVAVAASFVAIVAVLVLFAWVMIFGTLIYQDCIEVPMGIAPRNEYWTYHDEESGEKAVVMAKYVGAFDGYNAELAYRATSNATWRYYMLDFEGGKWSDVEMRRTPTNTFEVVRGGKCEMVVDTGTFNVLYGRDGHGHCGNSTPWLMEVQGE